MDPKDLPDITNNGPSQSKLSFRKWFTSLNEDPTFGGGQQDEISRLVFMFGGFNKLALLRIR